MSEFEHPLQRDYTSEKPWTVPDEMIFGSTPILPGFVGRYTLALQVVI